MWAADLGRFGGGLRGHAGCFTDPQQLAHPWSACFAHRPSASSCVRAAYQLAQRACRRYPCVNCWPLRYAIRIAELATCVRSLSVARQLTSDQNSTLGLANPQYKGITLPALLLGCGALALRMLTAICALCRRYVSAGRTEGQGGAGQGAVPGGAAARGSADRQGEAAPSYSGTATHVFAFAHMYSPLPLLGAHTVRWLRGGHRLGECLREDILRLTRVPAARE